MPPLQPGYNKEMGDEIESWDEPGGHVSIVYDEYAEENANPRQDSNVGTIVGYHPRYIIGDESGKDLEFKLTCAACGGEGDGPTEITCPTCAGDGKIACDPKTYFMQERGARVVIPLELYEHGGISIHCTSPYASASGDQWDTGLVGFIFDTPENVKECMGDNILDEDIEKALRSEVDIYDSFLKGEVYGYIVTNHQGKEDSCFGFIGDLAYIREEAVQALAGLNLPDRTIP